MHVVGAIHTTFASPADQDATCSAAVELSYFIVEIIEAFFTTIPVYLLWLSELSTLRGGDNVFERPRIEQ